VSRGYQARQLGDSATERSLLAALAANERSAVQLFTLADQAVKEGYRAADVAELLGMSRSTLYARIRDYL